MNAVVQSLDSWRVSLLRLTLRSRVLRTLYHQTTTRLALGLLLTTMVTLPLAFLHPQWLLAFGPMIFGYVHVLSSYRFTPPLPRFALFAVMTLLAVAIRFTPLSAVVPFGVWQVLIAAATFLLVERRPSWMALVLCALLLKLAWLEPLMFLGGSLILHNWVAFFTWIKRATTPARRKLAILATLVFLVIHLVVLRGSLDSWMPQVLFTDNTESTAWMLASWSTEPVVWYRLLVLYAFGLSIHYFIWLRAIPESLQKTEHPTSFRLTFQTLQSSLGVKTLALTLALMGAGTLLWLFSRPLGAQVYFEIAILHGWLELFFLLPTKENS